MTTHDYMPDDAKLTPELLDYLRTPEGQSLLRSAQMLITENLHDTPAGIAKLRKHATMPQAHAALVIATQAAKATAAKGKFEGLPFFWSVPEALEQATSLRVARYKAGLVPIDVSHVYDFCAGIGGDALAIAERFAVTAVEYSPVRAWCIRQNAALAGVNNRLHVAEQLLGADSIPNRNDAFFHIDPARRNHGKRSHRYDDMQPGPDVIDALIKNFSGGMIKLSPGVDFSSLPAGHLELISERGTVVQAILHVGHYSRPAQSRTATMLGSAITTFSATPEPVITLTTPQPFLFELDGAFTRAQLAVPFARSFDLAPLTIDGGYLTGTTHAFYPALTAFKVLAALPYHEKQVIETLRAAPQTANSPIEIKTRGLPDIDTDILQKRLMREVGPRGFTLLLYRQHNTTQAVIAQRI